MQNRLEKTFQRENGSHVKIIVEAFTSNYNGYKGLNYNVIVYLKNKGKRTWYSPVDTNDYSWRRLSIEERSKDNFKKQLNHVSAEEIQSVALELWESYKPKFI